MNHNSKHIMVDIETMGTGCDACIVSIGAVKFSVAEGVIEKFTTKPQWGGAIDKDTVQWWLKQSPAAVGSILPADAYEKLPTIKHSLQNFLSFAGDLPIWGNGVDFDNVILSTAAKNNGLKWPYRQNRCFRTFKNVFTIESPPRPVVAHDALHDAVAQAYWLIEIAKQHNINLG